MCQECRFLPCRFVPCRIGKKQSTHTTQGCEFWSPCNYHFCDLHVVVFPLFFFFCSVPIELCESEMKKKNITVQQGHRKTIDVLRIEILAHNSSTSNLQQHRSPSCSCSCSWFPISNHSFRVVCFLFVSLPNHRCAGVAMTVGSMGTPGRGSTKNMLETQKTLQQVRVQLMYPNVSYMFSMGRSKESTMTSNRVLVKF